MKKIFTLLALAGLLFSCAKDYTEVVEPVIISEEAALFDSRNIDGYMTVTNSLGANTRFNIEIASVDFYVDNNPVVLTENFVNTDFTVASIVTPMSPLNQQFILGYPLEVNSSASYLSRVDINFNYIFTGLPSNIDQEIVFIIRSTIYGDNIDKPAVGVTLVEIDPNTDGYTLSLDLYSGRQSSSYRIYLDIEAVYPDDVYGLYFDSRLTVTNKLNSSTATYFSLGDYKFTYGNYFGGWFVIGREGEMIYAKTAPGVGGLINLAPGESYSTPYNARNYVPLKEAPRNMWINIGMAGNMDHPHAPFTLTTTVRDFNGELLGQTSQKYSGYIETWGIDAFHIILGLSNEAASRREYTIYYDLTYEE
ncbi:MAG: hypothetical protein LIO79_03365 [Rikenellaceae bacterium]|nr:hypothetical protein [Rikenellaceae bacterium]